MARDTTGSVTGAALASLPCHGPLSAPLYWQRVRVLAGKRWLPFVVFYGVVQALDTLRVTSVIPAGDPAWLVAIFGWANIQLLIVESVTMLGAIVLSEALGLRGARHALASLAALSIVTVAAVLGLAWAQGGTLNRPMVEGNFIVSDAAYIGRTIWFNIASTMLLVAYFAFREQEAASLRLAQDAATERTRTERSTMAAKLKVLQAQVEPALLFGALDDVRELYLRAPGEADALLDDLIAYLRAALPQMRGEASTLAQEAALALSYVKVLPRGRHGELVAESTLDRTAADIPFPPMVLLPLVQTAALAPITRVTLSLHTPTLTGVRVTVDPASASSAWDDERLAPLRMTMQHYFGPDAGIDVAGPHATVRWA